MNHFSFKTQTRHVQSSMNRVSCARVRQTEGEELLRWEAAARVAEADAGGREAAECRESVLHFDSSFAYESSKGDPPAAPTPNRSIHASNSGARFSPMTSRR